MQQLRTRRLYCQKGRRRKTILLGLVDAQCSMRLSKTMPININHSEAAQRLISKTVRKNSIDVVWRIQKPQGLRMCFGQSKYMRDMSIWEKDFRRSLKLHRGLICESSNWRNLCALLLNCPSATTAKYRHMLDRLAREKYSPKVITGDYNAWPVEWSSRRNNERARILPESFPKWGWR